MTKSGFALNEINTPSRRAFRRRRLAPRNVPTSAVVYRGPISVPANDSVLIVLFDNAQISTGVGGDITGQFNNNPSSARNWAEMATSWGEYRVLGIKYTYTPFFAVNTATVNGFAGYHSIIHGVPAVPTTVSQAASTGVSRIWNAWKGWSREWRMSEVEEASFIDTTGPASTSNALNLLAVGGTASTAYGNMQIEYLVQFRVHNL